MPWISGILTALIRQHQARFPIWNVNQVFERMLRLEARIQTRRGSSRARRRSSPVPASSSRRSSPALWTSTLEATLGGRRRIGEFAIADGAPVPSLKNTTSSLLFLLRMLLYLHGKIYILEKCIQSGLNVRSLHVHMQPKLAKRKLKGALPYLAPSRCHSGGAPGVCPNR